MTDDVIFERQLRAIGTSLGTTFPPELLKFISAEQGSTLKMCARVGKKGRGICIWTKEGDVDGTNKGEGLSE